MKQEIITMFSKAKQWISVGINQALFYCKDWLNQVATYQAQLYSIAHQWLASQLPSAIQRYDQSVEYWRDHINYVTASTFPRDRVPMLAVEIPRDLWDHINDVYHAHQQSVSDNPSVRDAWEQYQLMYRLTSEGL